MPCKGTVYKYYTFFMNLNQLSFVIIETKRGGIPCPPNHLRFPPLGEVPSVACLGTGVLAGICLW